MPGSQGHQDFDDPAFLARLRAGEDRAAESVVHVYLPQVYRASRGAGLDDERARDVTQAAFLAFFQSLGNFAGRSRLRTWLFGILYNKISESWRTMKRETETDEIDGVMEDRFTPDGMWARPPREADREVMDAEIRTHLASCLDEVPQRQRMAFLLREVDGFATSEICKVLGVSGTNLGVMLYRVRNRLRECLEKRSLKG